MNYFDRPLMTCLLGLGLTIVPQISPAKPSLVEARNHLSKMDQQVQALDKQLNQNLAQKTMLSRQLDANQKKIKVNQTEAENIRHKILALKTEIRAIQEKIDKTQEKVALIKPSLQEHLNIHLRLEQQPLWQLALSAKNPFEYQQELELIHYLHQAEQAQLKNLNQAHHELNQSKQTMRLQKKSLKEYELSLLVENEKIAHRNASHLKSLEQIQAQMKTQTETLALLKQHQTKLKHLIQSLLKESTLQSHKPFSSLKKNLNTPIYQNLPQALNLEHGLLFPAPLHTPVYAVSSGKIVFSDWLNGYGYLIILDHGWGFMSLYGNNSELLKHKGEMVKQGDAIAKSGESGSFKKQGLYFEIRQRTQVVSARAWFKTHMS